MTKPGIKTTEFWMTVIAIAGMFVPTIMGALKPELFATVSAVLVGLYSIARGVAKITKTEVDDKLLEAIEQHILAKIKQ